MKLTIVTRQPIVEQKLQVLMEKRAGLAGLAGKALWKGLGLVGKGVATKKGLKFLTGPVLLGGLYGAEAVGGVRRSVKAMTKFPYGKQPYTNISRIYK